MVLPAIDFCPLERVDSQYCPENVWLLKELATDLYFEFATCGSRDLCGCAARYGYAPPEKALMAFADMDLLSKVPTPRYAQEAHSVTSAVAAALRQGNEYVLIVLSWSGESRLIPVDENGGFGGM